MNTIQVKMGDLPEKPFQKILSYLNQFDFSMKSLCYSERPSDFLWGKSRLVSGAFAQNFISSPRPASFFDTFGQTILSNLKHLRLCELHLHGTAFTRTLNSFGQLEELDIIRFGYPRTGSDPEIELELNLPMLNSIHLTEMHGIGKLTLDAPRLKQVKLSACSDLRLHLVHAEPVERLLVGHLAYIPVKKLKNLKYLYIGYYSTSNSPFLSSLEQLKEIQLVNLDHRKGISELFKQKQQSGLGGLKVYLRGLLLSGPDDPAIDSLCVDFDAKTLRCLAENPFKLAEEIPLRNMLSYTAIERVAPGSEMNILKRFTDLKTIYVDRPIQDVQRFLDFLKNLGIVELAFRCNQPQDLFDRLPEHSAAQSLAIESAPSDFRFLFRLKHLMYLFLRCSIDIETVRKILEELQFLSQFEFEYNNKSVEIAIEIGHSKQFEVSVDGKSANVADPNAAIQFITGDATRKKRKLK